jgi:hypothetical protein
MIEKPRKFLIRRLFAEFIIWGYKDEKQRMIKWSIEGLGVLNSRAFR